MLLTVDSGAWRRDTIRRSRPRARPRVFSTVDQLIDLMETRRILRTEIPARSHHHVTGA